MENKPEKEEFTAWVKKSITGEGYYGFVGEVPGAASEGKTKKELVENLKDAINTVREFHRTRSASKAKKEEYEKVELCA